MNSSKISPRTNYVRRAEYVSNWPPDEFIVPILKNWIDTTIRSILLSANLDCRVLDVGCGRQPFRSLIESLRGAYTGLDIEQTPDGTVAIIGAIDEQLSSVILNKGPFGLILCTEVLEHVADWTVAFNNLTTLLTHGGYIILTCPHSYQLHEEPNDFFRATDHAVSWHARRAGLEIVRLERLGNAWDVLGGVLANIHPLSLRTSLLDRLVGRVARSLLYRVLYPLLRSRWLHRRLDPGGTLYLANAAVLRKP